MSAPLRVLISRIRPNPDQPREHFAPEKLAELVSSLRTHGMMNPPVVYPEGDHFVLLAGERRLRAAAEAGWSEVPVLVRAVPTPAERLELALIENLQREDLDPIEAARGYQRLVIEHGHTQEQVAEKVGKDRATVANAIRLLKLPELGREALRSGKISAGHARALLPVADAAQFKEILGRIIAEDLSVRETERLVAHSRKPATKLPPDRNLQRLGDRVARVLATRVRLEGRKDGGGRMMISYESAEDLARLVALMEGA